MKIPYNFKLLIDPRQLTFTCRTSDLRLYTYTPSFTYSTKGAHVILASAKYFVQI